MFDARHKRRKKNTIQPQNAQNRNAHENFLRFDAPLLELKEKWRVITLGTRQRSFVFECDSRKKLQNLSLIIANETNPKLLITFENEILFEAYSVLARPEMSSEFCCIAVRLVNFVQFHTMIHTMFFGLDVVVKCRNVSSIQKCLAGWRYVRTQRSSE